MGRRPKDPTAAQGTPGRPLTFPAPPGIAAELERLAGETDIPPATIKRHLAAEAAQLLLVMQGSVRQIVGRRMRFLPEEQVPLFRPEQVKE